MKWNRFTVKTKTEAEDIVISTLAEVGIEGVEIQDKQPLTEEDKAQMFVDIMPEGPADDGVAYLNFYLEEDADKDAILKDVREALDDLRNFMDIGEATIEESQTEDKDWINNWKQYFHQFYVDDILIVPSWEEVKEEDKDKMILHIDPGTAFGTGMHETTQLVIRQLKKYVTPDTENMCWEQTWIHVQFRQLQRIKKQTRSQMRLLTWLLEILSMTKQSRIRQAMKNMILSQQIFLQMF